MVHIFPLTLPWGVLVGSVWRCQLQQKAFAAQNSRRSKKKGRRECMMHHNTSRVSVSLSWCLGTPNSILLLSAALRKICSSRNCTTVSLELLVILAALLEHHNRPNKQQQNFTEYIMNIPCKCNNNLANSSTIARLLSTGHIFQVHWLIKKLIHVQCIVIKYHRTTK